MTGESSQGLSVFRAIRRGAEAAAQFFASPAAMMRRGIGKRMAIGITASRVGLTTNLIIFIVKLAAALLSGSVAAAADAVNTLSDFGTCIVTWVGFRMAARPPDRDHPFGHGRGEYIASLLVAVVIVAIGFNLLRESILHIIHPQTPSGGALVLGLLVFSMAAKLFLGLFFRRWGRRIDAEVLHAAAADSFCDIISTMVVTAGILLGKITDFPVDGAAGIIVAGIVLWAGVNIVRRSLSLLLGEAPDGELVNQLKDSLMACPGIRGVHDVIIHNYGPGSYFATAHAEVDCTGDLISMHDTLEAAEVTVAKKLPIQLILHCDPFGEDNAETRFWRTRCEDALLEINPLLKLYEFRLKHDEAGLPELSFHILTSCGTEKLSREMLVRQLAARLAAHGPVPAIRLELTQNFTGEEA